MEHLGIYTKLTKVSSVYLPMRPKEAFGAQSAQQPQSQDSAGRSVVWHTRHIHQSWQKAHSHRLPRTCCPNFLLVLNHTDKSEAMDNEGRWGFHGKDGSENKSQVADGVLREENKGHVA